MENWKKVATFFFYMVTSLKSRSYSMEIRMLNIWDEFFIILFCPGLDAWCLPFSLYNYTVTPLIFLYVCISSLSCALSHISAPFYGIVMHT